MFYKAVVQSVLRMMWQATKNWWIDKNLEEVGLYSMIITFRSDNIQWPSMVTWPISDRIQESEWSNGSHSSSVSSQIPNMRLRSFEIVIKRHNMS